MNRVLYYSINGSAVTWTDIAFVAFEFGIALWYLIGAWRRTSKYEAEIGKGR